MSNELFTRQYWADTTERVVSTAAQAGVAAFGLDQVTDVHLDLGELALFMAFAALASLLKCLAAIKVGAANTAAMLPAGPDTEAGATLIDVALVVLVACVVVMTIDLVVNH